MTGHRGRGRDCARGGCARAHGINLIFGGKLLIKVKGLFQMYENEQLKYHCLVAANHDHHKEQAEEKGGEASHISILKVNYEMPYLKCHI